MNGMVKGVVLALSACVSLASCGEDDAVERQWNLGVSAGSGGIAYADGAVWVGLSDQQVSPGGGAIQVVRLDPADGSVDLRLEGYGLDVVGAVDGEVWIGDGGSALVSLDPASGEVHRDTGVLDLTDEPRSLVLAGERLFGIGFGDVVQEFDRSTGALFGDVPDPQGDGTEPLDAYSRALAGGDAFLYLEVEVDGARSLAAFDPTAGDYAWSYPLPDYLGPAGLDVRDGALWMLLSSTDPATPQQVMRLDAATGVLLSRSDLPAATAMIEGDTVALRFSPDGNPWVLVVGDSTVLRLDPATGAVEGSFAFSSRPVAFAVSDDAVFTVASGSGVVTRVDRGQFAGASEE